MYGKKKEATDGDPSLETEQQEETPVSYNGTTPAGEDDWENWNNHGHDVMAAASPGGGSHAKKTKNRRRLRRSQDGAAGKEPGADNEEEPAAEEVSTTEKSCAFSVNIF